MEEKELSQLLQVRRDKLSELQAEGRDPFQVTKFNRTAFSAEVIENFEELEEKPVSVAGRIMSKRGMGSAVGVLRKMLSVLERYNISVDYVPNGIDNVSVVMSSESLGNNVYTILSEIQAECEPDTLEVHDKIAVVAAVGRQPSCSRFSENPNFGASGFFSTLTRSDVIFTPFLSG